MTKELITNTPPPRHLVSFSGGKDSTAMLLMMKERGMQIDEVIFIDTGLEFPQLYEHVDKVEKYIGMPITRLKAEKPFEYWMLEHLPKSRTVEGSKYYGIKGQGWPHVKGRWCNSYLKVDVVERYLKGKNFIQYIGIACDEPKRIKNVPNKRYPLVEWQMTEKDCLEYCKSKGFDFGGLYNHFGRLGCWLCPFQSLNDLRNLRKYYKDLWKRLLELDTYYITYYITNYAHVFQPYGNKCNVFELDARFEIEELLNCQSSRKFARGWRDKVREYLAVNRVLEDCSWYKDKLY